MVQMTDDEFMARKRRQQPSSLDGLTQFDLDRIGTAVRLNLPMTDRITLEMAADLLRGLADRIEFVLQRQDLPLVARLQMIKTEAAMINRRIRDRFEQSTANGLRAPQ